MALNNTNKMTMVMRINHKIESLTAGYGIYPLTKAWEHYSLDILSSQNMVIPI